MKLSQLTLSICSALFVLTGCQTPPDHPDGMKLALDDAIAEHEKPKAVKPLTTVPTSVQQELMKKGSSAANDNVGEKRLQISADNVDAKDFFTAISAGSSYSIAVHPDVEGAITLSLSDVTLIEALAVVEEIYGFEIRQQKNVIQVYPAGLRTETIPLNYLFIKRYGQSNTSINSGGVSGADQNSGGNNGSSNNNNGNNSGGNNSSNGNSNSSDQMQSGVNISTENESDFWKELKETLKELIGDEPGRTVFVSPQAGLVTIKGMPDEINAVKRFIKDTEAHLHRQVVIEAKIMEVTLRDDYQQGIRWEQVLSDSAGTASTTLASTGNIIGNIISSEIAGQSSISFNGSDFTGVIELLQTQGNVQVLSSPRITATNNQKAVIKVGEDEYFVTDVSSTTITGTNPTVTPEIDLTPFFSGIALDVTPQIDKEGGVILHVHPSVTVTDEQTKTIALGGDEIILPLAQTNIRESDTVIRAKSGEIVVIGGLIETRKIQVEAKIPLLGDIPFLGELFKSKGEEIRKTELVILLKPIVVGQDTWKTQLKEARAILTEWFPEDEDAEDEKSQEESKDSEVKGSESTSGENSTDVAGDSEQESAKSSG